MAYTFFPKTATEIHTTLKSKPEKKVEEIMNLFATLHKMFPKVETPINIDPTNIGKVNVARSLEGDVDLAVLKRVAGLKTVSLKFGSGSSGNRGVNNRGNLFEPQFAAALDDWWTGIKISDYKMIVALEDLKK